MMLNVKPQKQQDPFYCSEAWRKLRRVVLRRDGYRCVSCLADVSGPGQARVDHIKPRREFPDLALNPYNLRTLCPACDNRRHREKAIQSDVVKGIGRDGLPLDPNHPWRKGVSHAAGLKGGEGRACAKARG